MFWHAPLDMRLIAIVVSSLILTSSPKYMPSVASLVHTKLTSPRGAGTPGIVFIGRTLAYRLKRCLNDTATLFGAPTIPGVVVGPLKHASLFLSISQVSSGIRESPPCFSQYVEPASHMMNSTSVPAALHTDTIASTSSGPTPSPLIIAAFLLIIFPIIYSSIYY